MKSFFLAICIAALVTPASARPWAAFYCGKLQVALIPSKYLDRATPFVTAKKDSNPRRPLSNRLFSHE